MFIMNPPCALKLVVASQKILSLDQYNSLYICLQYGILFQTLIVFQFHCSAHNTNNIFRWCQMKK